MEIIFNNVTYIYKNKKKIEKLNLIIESNKITGITGDNKTLICELLDGIKMPTDGEIIIGNTIVDKSNLKQIRKTVSMIHQNFEEQFFTNNVKDEIMFLIERLSYKPKDINKKMHQAIQIVGLDEDILDKEIKVLTTGEKKLLQIAVSLIYNPDIIIFDETFTTLDKTNKRKIIRLIKDLKNKYNKTIIISSNDVNLLYELTDNIIIIKKTKLLLTGKTTSIYQNPNLLGEIELPDLVKFVLLAKKKKIKLSYHRDILDLIKDVYKHV